MKRSQVSSQVFTYIIAAVVAAVILVMGATMIGNLINSSKQINIGNIKSDFESQITIMSTKYEAVKKYKFNLPNDFDEICFVSSLKDDGTFSDEVKSAVANSPTPYLSIQYSVGTPDGTVPGNAEANVFLMKERSIEYSFYVEKLDVVGEFLCAPRSNATVWLKGMGRYTELSRQ